MYVRYTTGYLLIFGLFNIVYFDNNMAILRNFEVGRTLAQLVKGPEILCIVSKLRTLYGLVVSHFWM